MDIVELEDHPTFVRIQYHPEFLSRPIKPFPPYLYLLLASVGICCIITRKAAGSHPGTPVVTEVGSSFDSVITKVSINKSQLICDDSRESLMGFTAMILHLAFDTFYFIGTF